MEETKLEEVIYDFIVVGSGPAGSALAWSLAHSANNDVRILLMEAGGLNDDYNLRVDGQRWQTFQNKEMNWGYKTIPQTHCANRELDYARGKGMGGSSAINFSVFTVGAKDDYDEWARQVGDGAFRWENMQRRLKTLEAFHSDLPQGVHPKFASPRPSDHGTEGPLRVGYPREFEEDLIPLMTTLEKAGLPLNPDHNSGNPLGMSLMISSAHHGVRSTAADLLVELPGDVVILTDSPVQRILLEGKRAIGVESNGKKYLVSKEVIVCAGSLDTPRILMHSGIGPSDQLKKYHIPVVLDMPSLGRGLRDHVFTFLLHKRTLASGSKRGDFYGDQAAMDAAMEQWRRDGTGPWAKYACGMGIGFFKLGKSLTSSPEFMDLPAAEQKHLLRETIPHYEIATHFPVHWFIPDFVKDDRESYQYLCLNLFLIHPQSQGTVSLQSSDPNVPLLYDPHFLESAFDKRIAIESFRAVLELTKSREYAKDTIETLSGPKSESDEDLLDYWKKTGSSTWHMTGTAKMGRRGHEDAVVDSDFRVIGIDGLRVADMSVVPVLVSGHTQVAAYLTGLTCAERILEKYHGSI